MRATIWQLDYPPSLVLLLSAAPSRVKYALEGLARKNPDLEVVSGLICSSIRLWRGQTLPQSPLCHLINTQAGFGNNSVDLEIPEFRA